MAMAGAESRLIRRQPSGRAPLVSGWVNFSVFAKGATVSCGHYGPS